MFSSFLWIWRAICVKIFLKKPQTIQSCKTFLGRQTDREHMIADQQHLAQLIDWLIIYSRVFHLNGDITMAAVTERSDSRRILTPGSFFYVEMWPPVNILRHEGSFFSCRKSNQSINSTVSRRKVAPGEYWLGVKFLRRILTPGSLFYWVIFLQYTQRKATPVEYWPGVTFLHRKMTLGHYSTGTFFYNLQGEKWPQDHEFYGKGSHFSP
jgi:hypothetical protein